MSAYRLLPDNLLVALYQELKKNIENGLLSELMHLELRLMYEEMLEREL